MATIAGEEPPPFTFAISYDWRESTEEDFQVLANEDATKTNGKSNTAAKDVFGNKRNGSDGSMEEWSGDSKWGGFDESFRNSDSFSQKIIPPHRHSTSLASPRSVCSEKGIQRIDKRDGKNHKNNNHGSSSKSKPISQRHKPLADSKRMITSASLSPRGLRKLADDKRVQSKERRNVVSGSLDKWFENSAWDGLDMQIANDHCSLPATSSSSRRRRSRSPTSPRMRSRKAANEAPLTPNSYEVPSKASEGRKSDSKKNGRSRRRSGSSNSRSLSPGLRSLKSIGLNSPLSVPDDRSMMSQPVGIHGLVYI